MIKTIDLFNSLIIFLGVGFSSTNSSSTTCSNKTDFTTSASSTFDCGCFTNVLMVTSSVRMLNWVHSNTTNLRPAVPLDLVLVVRTPGFQDRLVNTSTTSNDTNHSSVVGGNNFFCSRWKLYTSLFTVGVVGDDSGVVSGCTGKSATVSGLFFKITYYCSFGHSSDRHNVANLECGFFAAVYELPGVHAFGGNKQFFSCLKFVGISEVYPS
ncbi:GSCOCG00003449001-RA-CDS [Cotesia congregata]|nr:GSCOCG00003449001-RA-CDS [Cotesia congregata]